MLQQQIWCRVEKRNMTDQAQTLKTQTFGITVSTCPVARININFVDYLPHKHTTQNVTAGEIS